MNSIWFLIIALIIIGAVYAIVMAVDKADERRAAMHPDVHAITKLTGGKVKLLDKHMDVHGDVTRARYPSVSARVSNLPDVTKGI